MMAWSKSERADTRAWLSMNRGLWRDLRPRQPLLMVEIIIEPSLPANHPVDESMAAPNANGSFDTMQFLIGLVVLMAALLLEASPLAAAPCTAEEFAEAV